MFCGMTSISFGQSYRFLQTEIYGIQAFGGFVGNSFSSEFTQFSGTVSCDEFTSGSGNGFSIGAQVEYPLMNALSVTCGIGLYDRSGVLETSSTFPIRDGSAQFGFTQATMANIIDARMKFLEFHTDLRYNIFEMYGFVIRGIGGIRIGFAPSGEYVQSTRIVTPESIGFIVGDQILQERTLSSGAINTFNAVQVGGVLGIEPMVRISPSMHLTASALYDIPLSSALSDATLNIAGFRGQIGLRYSIRLFAPSPNTP
jgi:hypothetical protein